MSRKDEEWVFALDIGAKCSGYCYGTADGQAVKYGKYVADKKVVGRGQKLYNFSQWLAKILNSLPYKPTRTVIEAPYYNKNVKTYGILCQYVGVAERELYRLTRVGADFVAPSAVKSCLKVPKGKTHDERKYNMVKEINRRLGLNLSYHKSNKNISDDDIADAIGLFLTHCIRMNDETS
jgi:Holliday junction resolvasome RuvABC endonuclease subunit